MTMPTIKYRMRVAEQRRRPGGQHLLESRDFLNDRWTPPGGQGWTAPPGGQSLLEDRAGQCLLEDRAGQRLLEGRAEQRLLEDRAEQRV